MDILDRSWGKTAFLVGDDELAFIDTQNRYHSSARSKFTDTRMGGGIGINTKYQFCRYSDIRVSGRLVGRDKVKVGRASGHFGMGRYYSEAIDDNGRCIFMQFGVPKFNSLINFLRRATDYKSAIMVQKGRTVWPTYDVARAITGLGLVMAAPLLTIPIIAGSYINEFLFGRPTAKFYTLKPTMHAYWSMVQTIINAMGVNTNLYPRVLDTEKYQSTGQPVVIDEGFMTDFHKLYPELFNGMGYIDVFSVASRAQRLANKAFAEQFDAANVATSTDYLGYVAKEITEPGAHATMVTDSKGEHTLAATINRAMMFSDWFGSDPGDNSPEMDPVLDPEKGQGEEREEKSWFKKYFENTDAQFRDGGAFAVFRVDETGALSDSFTNSAVESDLSQKINSMSSEARQARFTFADGNFAGNIGGAVGDAVTAVAGAAKDLVMDTAAGAAAGVTFGISNIPLVLSGIGYIDIPKNWQSSSANLARLTYSMDLISPYNNPISRMQDIWIPLAMILAGALPRSTGAMSYGSPFICSLYDRGRVQIKTGLIESLSIERGICSLPFTRRGEALGVRVTFSILDLSSIMHAPISSGGIFGSSEMISEDSVFVDYLAVLAGMDLGSQIYPAAKAQLNMRKRLAEFSRFTSPAWAASWTKDTVTSGLGSFLTLGTGNLLQMAVRGSELTTGSMGRI